jgi:hypothetical protein
MVLDRQQRVERQVLQGQFRSISQVFGLQCRGAL